MELTESEAGPHREHLFGHCVERTPDVALLLRRKDLGLVRLYSVGDVNYPLQAALPKTGLYDVRIVVRVISHAKLLVDPVEVGDVDNGADARPVLELTGVHRTLYRVSQHSIGVRLLLAVAPDLRPNRIEHHLICHSLLVKFTDRLVELSLRGGVILFFYRCRGVEALVFGHRRPAA